MKIYRVEIGHKIHGENWDSKTIDANNFNEALEKIKKNLNKNEIIESVEILASTD